ncbi:MAG TPA: methyltransferase domain-containing protein, partial [Campylobacterales bacterium]|nr:methyltransferase domain-containing protein [Campylobacterales bacterium]
KSSIDTLSKKYPEFTFEECDFSEYIPLGSEVGSFDLAISVLVFLHITDNVKLEACFKNISSMLKNEGYFIVLDAVSANGLKGKQKKMADGPEFDENYHNKVRYLDYYVSVANKNNMKLAGLYPAFNITQNSFDFKTSIGHKIGNWYFKKLLNPLLSRCSEQTGEFLGKTLVSIDKTLFSALSTSSKWLVFKKVA